MEEEEDEEEDKVAPACKAPKDALWGNATKWGDRS